MSITRANVSALASRHKHSMSAIGDTNSKGLEDGFRLFVPQDACNLKQESRLHEYTSGCGWRLQAQQDLRRH